MMVISPKNKTVFNFRGELIKEFIKHGYEVVVTGPNKDYIGDIEKLGASFIEIPFIKDNIGVMGDLKYCNQLIRAIKQQKPDKIFLYTIKPVIYGSIAGAKAGVKDIYPMITGLGRMYTGNNLKSKIYQTFIGILYRKAFKGCTKVIFQNIDDMNLFIEKGYLPKDKAKKIDGSGVNMDKFKFTELPNSPVFLMISRIIKEKGVFEFCDAAKLMKRKYPHARFILLGGYDKSVGAIKPEELTGYTNSGIVELPGEVKDVYEILNKAFVFVLPTYYREGIPRTILEAMACGKPVITTDWVGTKEAVSDGINGFLIPIKDSGALYEKMEYALSHYDKMKEMGKKSHEICQRKFDVNIINKKMLEIMEIN